MFKNVSLRPRVVSGRGTWRLVGPDGKEIAAFSAFAESIKSMATNSIASYARHVAQFLDYLIEVADVVGQGAPLTKLQLTEAVEAYGDYLLLGTDASNEIASSIARSIPPGVNSPASLVPKKAAVRRFLRMSEAVRKELQELARMGAASQMRVDEQPLLPELGQQRLLTPFEIRAMQANSMIAGVVAGGPKLIAAIPLGKGSGASSYEHSRAFPYDRAMDLIDAMPTCRDSAFYALRAACGCRGHEALQVLFEDVDVDKATVSLVDPDSRPGHRSYRFLSHQQREKLAWKGRTSSETLLIEPFASAFFQWLQKYLDKEYIGHGRHSFLFQFLADADRGMPYFLSAASSRREVFERACRRIGVTLPPGTGAHSLRHMYGTYLLNYFPRANGDYGLPVPLVQQLMGHANEKQTLKYARFDHDLLKLEIANANRVLFQRGTPKSVLQLKLEALEANIAKV